MLLKQVTSSKPQGILKAQTPEPCSKTRANHTQSSYGTQVTKAASTAHPVLPSPISPHSGAQALKHPHLRILALPPEMHWPLPWWPSSWGTWSKTTFASGSTGHSTLLCFDFHFLPCRRENWPQVQSLVKITAVTQGTLTSEPARHNLAAGRQWSHIGLVRKEFIRG